MTRSELLDSLRVASPCPVAWSSMAGDDRVRFCDKCRKNVYDVAVMTTEEALTLIERVEGPLCMQVTRRPDGRIATGDCRGALRRARQRGLMTFAVMLPVIVLAQLWSQVFGFRALQSFFQSRPAPSSTALYRNAELEARFAAISREQEVVLGGLIAPESRERIRRELEQERRASANRHRR